MLRFWRDWNDTDHRESTQGPASCSDADTELVHMCRCHTHEPIRSWRTGQHEPKAGACTRPRLQRSAKGLVGPASGDGISSTSTEPAALSCSIIAPRSRCARTGWGAHMAVGALASLPQSGSAGAVVRACMMASQ